MPYRTAPPMDASFKLNSVEIQQAVLEWLKKHKGVVVDASDDLKWEVIGRNCNGAMTPIKTDLKITVVRTQYVAQGETPL